MSGVVGAINEDIKRQEKRFKVIEIQERWDTVRSLLSPARGGY